MRFSVLLDCVSFSFEQNIDVRGEKHFVQEKLILLLTFYPWVASTDRILNNSDELVTLKSYLTPLTAKNNMTEAMFFCFRFRVDGRSFPKSIALL